jgi:large subunit ribosomal protein L6
MSKIGRQPINIPAGVEVRIDGRFVFAKGPKGELQRKIPKEIKAEIKDGQMVIEPAQSSKRTNALWGLTRSLLANLVKGVVEGFEKKLEIEGVGFRANVQGDKLVLSLGFSHPVEIPSPKGIKLQVEKNAIIVSGADKELVGQTAANIRALKKPEPYKGKGIRYQGEVIKRKAGKKAVGTV